MPSTPSLALLQNGKDKRFNRLAPCCCPSLLVQEDYEQRWEVGSQGPSPSVISYPATPNFSEAGSKVGTEVGAAQPSSFNLA